MAAQEKPVVTVRFPSAVDNRLKRGLRVSFLQVTPGKKGLQ
jgi:hypothetical protein